MPVESKQPGFRQFQETWKATLQEHRIIPCKDKAQSSRLLQLSLERILEELNPDGSVGTQCQGVPVPEGDPELGENRLYSYLLLSTAVKTLEMKKPTFGRS